MIDTILQDLRYAARTLRRNPTFAVVSMVCLGVGIGANTTVFSVVNGALVRELPFRDGDRLAALYASSETRGIDRDGLAFADLEDLRRTGVFDDVAGVLQRSFTLSGPELSERVQGAAITPNLFDMLGMHPARGRTFSSNEGTAAGFESAAIISDRLWKNRFGADPGIIGQTIRINNRELTIVGLMPPGFRFPEREDVWVPYAPADATAHDARALIGIARLRAGITPEAARSRAESLSHQLAQQYPDTHRGWDINVERYREFIVDSPARRFMLLMLGSVVFVLLIAVANVANLLLARAMDRGHEIALRAAIGASRRRVIQQLLTESILLSSAGAALGIVIAVWWLDAIVRSIPEDLAFWLHFSIDGAVLLYTLIISLTAGILFGLVPALQLSRPDLQSGARDSARTGDTHARSRLRSALVVAEIALSLVLLVGAVLMVQSFLRLGLAQPGFNQRNLQTLRVTITDPVFDDLQPRFSFVTRAAAALTGLPGVHAAVATTAIPADDGGASATVEVEGSSLTPNELPFASVIGSSTGLFETLQVRLLSGRDFTAGEIVDTLAPVAIVSQNLAALLWPGEDPIGRRVRIGGHRWHLVIGVAPQFQYEEFGEETPQSVMQVHVPYPYLPYRQVSFLVRGTNATPTESAIRAELRRVDSGLAPFDIMSMEQRRRETTWEQRLFGTTFGVFGGIAFVLALAGVYGVMAFTVARRRREIGIRVTLGASPTDILRLVLSRAMLIAVVGVAMGVAGALGLARLLSGLLWGVSATDPATFVLSALLLGSSALLASYVPARRATRVEPVSAIRSE